MTSDPTLSLDQHKTRGEQGAGDLTESHILPGGDFCNLCLANL